MLRAVVVDRTALFVGPALRSHVQEALAALRKFRDASGAPLALCLVSDRDASERTASGRREARRDELAVLDEHGLRRFFTPVARHVTLVAEVDAVAGAGRADRGVHEAAATKLGGGVDVDECVVVTSKPVQAAACRGLGMQALVVGEDASDWSEVPLLVRQLAGPDDPGNTELALDVWFGAHHDQAVVVLDGAPSAPTARVRVRQRGASGRGRALPAVVSFDRLGCVADVDWSADETAAFHRSLREHGQLVEEGEPLSPGVTHQVERDEKGEPVVRRRRFTAI